MGKSATTVLCFMIKSISSKYQDIIQMVPLNGINTMELKKHFLKALSIAMRAGFEIIAAVCDNHSVNRAFMMNYLSDGSLKACVQNPLDSSKKLFLLLDPTHTFKNMYNNFQKKGVFKLPACELCPQPIIANFHHANVLYEKDSLLHIRMAHKLSPYVLNPSNIQRQSAKLFVGLFHESTAATFQYYVEREGMSEWEGTYIFVRLMSNLWKIINVKNSTFGYKTRDTLRTPIKSENDEKIQILKQYLCLFKQWQASKFPGLSAPTFSSVILMCESLAQMSVYLINHIHYLLLGGLQSDPLESRYGRLR